VRTTRGRDAPPRGGVSRLRAFVGSAEPPVPTSRETADAPDPHEAAGHRPGHRVGRGRSARRQVLGGQSWPMFSAVDDAGSAPELALHATAPSANGATAMIMERRAFMGSSRAAIRLAGSPPFFDRSGDLDSKARVTLPRLVRSPSGGLRRRGRAKLQREGDGLPAHDAGCVGAQHQRRRRRGRSLIEKYLCRW
jgi:hypothetical protein